MEIAMYMEQTWKRLCTSARVPAHLDQNQMDEILNVATSWDRKRFGKSFKPIR
jgi:DNA-binding TFAR19-related protein (PDSD5 family)